ncbi:hypothetical protein [Parvularcula sp. IMCC14364]|uniref:hypothetical protein n=1 Tax=Parvularcula sp. IMCC14364 TaxID=3067902 RepID=UPI002742668B|nr:hypothetical protein [Parvularcula sp. IMCC14364]
MLDFVRKYESFRAAEQTGLSPAGLNMSFYQQIAVQDFLSGIEMASVAEINPGEKSLLDGLIRHNETYSLQMQQTKIEKVSVYSGSKSGDERVSGAEIAFDLLFSCGEFEKFGSSEIAEALDVCRDMLRPGGVMIHALQFYIAPTPTPFWLDRFAAFHQSFQRGGVEPVGNVMGPEPLFQPDMASTSDAALFELYKASPNMAELRMQAQNVCLIYAARRVS